MKNLRKGFTLIELLVVIAIIAILATISVGTFRSNFGKARDARRQSTVNSVVLSVKVARASQETFQYTLDGNDPEGDLTALLEAEGLRVPEEQGEFCYIYGSSDPDGDEFFVAIESESGDPIIAGTPQGVDDATAASSISCVNNGTPSVTGYVVTPFGQNSNN